MNQMTGYEHSIVLVPNRAGYFSRFARQRVPRKRQIYKHFFGERSSLANEVGRDIYFIRFVRRFIAQAHSLFLTSSRVDTETERKIATSREKFESDEPTFPFRIPNVERSIPILTDRFAKPAYQIAGKSLENIHRISKRSGNERMFLHIF